MQCLLGHVHNFYVGFLMNVTLHFPGMWSVGRDALALQTSSIKLQRNYTDSSNVVCDLTQEEWKSGTSH